MCKTAAKENKMAVMPVNRLMMNMGVPMIISMMLQAVYNIVDSAFVANMEGTGEMALNALTLAFPVQMFMVAVGIGTGVGVNALLAKRMGQGDMEEASKTAGNGVFLMAVIYVLFLLSGLFGTEGYIATQTKNPVIAEMAADYLKICCIWSFGILFFSLYEKILQAAGKSACSTIAQITGAIVNIVLDPVMIYGWFGCPEFGVKGAAYATVTGQMVSAFTGLIFHLKINREINNTFACMKPSGRIIKGIYSIGFAAIIAQALMSVMTYLLNVIFVRIGENVVTAYGLYYKIQQFIPFAGIFGLSGETKQLCVSAMRVISVSYVFAGANIASQGVFQALDSGLESFVISVCRQFLFVIPTAYLFVEMVISGICGTWFVWMSFVIAEVLSVIVSAIFMKRVNTKKVMAMS